MSAVQRFGERVPLCSVFVYVPTGGPVDRARIHRLLRNMYTTVTCLRWHWVLWCPANKHADGKERTESEISVSSVLIGQ